MGIIQIERTAERRGVVMATEMPQPEEPEFQQPAQPEYHMAKPGEFMWGMLCHLSAFAFFILPAFGNIIAPLVIWLIKKQEMPFVDDQGKESLNFQISIWIYMIASAILILIVVGMVLLPAVFIFWFIETIIASVKASNGEAYRYPLTIRFIK